MVETVAMIPKTSDGIKKFNATITSKAAAEKINAHTGTPFFPINLNFLGAFPFKLSEYNVRLVLNKQLLVADKAAVKTTKFKIPAAPLIPTPENT